MKTVVAMASNPVRFIAASKKSPLGSLQLHLHVKPGARGDREGVRSVSESAIDLCVAAQARDGEANKAVIKLLSDVLGVPKSRLHLSHGMKSRDKTVVLGDVKGNGEEEAQKILDILRKASD